MATHFSILAFRIPWTEDPDGVQSTGSERVRHDRDSHTHTQVQEEEQSQERFKEWMMLENINSLSLSMEYIANIRKMLADHFLWLELTV